MTDDVRILTADDVRRGLRTKFVGQNVYYFGSIDSTNRMAKDLAQDGAPDGTLVIADSQTAGRGRLNRQWLSPSGTCLLISLVFRPQLAPQQAMRTVMICSLAAVDAIEDTTALQAQVKWPNDIVIGGRKVGGLLAEVGVKDERLDYVVVGIGLNVNVEFNDRLKQYPPDSAPDTSRASLNVLASRSTSLLMETGRRVPRVDLLQAFLRLVEKRYEALRAGVIPNAEWGHRLETINQMVTVATSDEVVTGRAERVDSDGALIIRLPDGGRRRVVAGDVTLRNVPQT